MDIIFVCVSHKQDQEVYYPADYIRSFNNAMQIRESTGFKQTYLSEDWSNTMKEDLEALKKIETWIRANLPED